MFIFPLLTNLIARAVSGRNHQSHNSLSSRSNLCSGVITYAVEARATVKIMTESKFVGQEGERVRPPARLSNLAFED